MFYALANYCVVVVFRIRKDGPPASLAFVTAQDMRVKIMRLSGRRHSLRAFLLEDGPAHAVRSGVAVDASALAAAV
jgi:hypothetical protein